jgi:hypothetical protein
VAVVVVIAPAATIPAPNLTYFARESADFMRPNVRGSFGIGGFSKHTIVSAANARSIAIWQ